MPVARLPDPGNFKDLEETVRYLRQLIKSLESILTKQLNTVKGWSPSNVPTTSLDTYRTFDAAAADLDTTRKALAVLIMDLRKQGLLAKDV